MTTAPEHLTSLYDALSHEVTRTFVLREALLRRTGGWGLVGPLLGPRAAAAMVRRSGTLALAPSRCSMMQAAAEPEQRNDPRFAAATRPYWLEDLARELSVTSPLDRDRVAALEQIHQARSRGSAALGKLFSPRAAITGILTAFGLLASQLPKEAYEQLGWSTSYGDFRLQLFVALLLLIALLLWSWVASSRQGASDRAVIEAVGLLLMYWSLDLGLKDGDGEVDPRKHGTRATRPQGSSSGPSPDADPGDG